MGCDIWEEWGEWESKIHLLEAPERGVEPKIRLAATGCTGCTGCTGGTGSTAGRIGAGLVEILGAVGYR